MDALELLKIIGGLISILNFFIVIVVAVGGWLAFKKITNNDLQHIGADIKELSLEQKCIKDKVFILSEDVCYLKGTLGVRRGAIKSKKTNKLKKAVK
jgi:hypothetical protein